jgi:hypothetical protein
MMFTPSSSGARRPDFKHSHKRAAMRRGAEDRSLRRPPRRAIRAAQGRDEPRTTAPKAGRIKNATAGNL